MGVPWASRGDDVIGADVDVVIAEDAEALGSFESGEDLGSYAGGFPGLTEGEGPRLTKSPVMRTRSGARR
jgi:hypothetical protein